MLQFALEKALDIQSELQEAEEADPNLLESAGELFGQELARRPALLSALQNQSAQPLETGNAMEF